MRRSLPSENPRETAIRLARDKAVAVAARFQVRLLSDRIRQWTLDGVPLGKPLSHEAALAQLQSLQGRTAVFYTALAVIGPSAGSVQVDCVSTTVTFRNLPMAQLETYLRADQPYDCAAQRKIESLGIVLIESVESR